MKYLIEIHHGIGDIVQMTGVIESINKADSNAYISLILNKDAYKSLFESDDRINEIYRIDFNGMSKMEIVKEVIKMRKKHYDYFLLSPISNRKASRILTKMIGARVSAGEQLKYIAEKEIHVLPENVHIVERNENVLRSLNIANEIFMPSLEIKKVQLPLEIKENTIALCIGTSIPQKTWALGNYINIAKSLIQDGYHIVILGGKKEAEELQNVELFPEISNLAGITSLIQSAKVAEKCRLVIGGDTGVMHMAAAVGATTLTLFSCTDPGLHSSYSENSYFFHVNLSCQYCYEKGQVLQCSDYKCIKNIHVEDIYCLVTEILNNKADKRYKYEINARD